MVEFPKQPSVACPNPSNPGYGQYATGFIVAFAVAGSGLGLLEGDSPSGLLSTYVCVMLGMPFVALVFAVIRATRKFGIGMLLGSLLGWGLFVTTCSSELNKNL